MKVRILTPAGQELREAKTHYMATDRRLGDAFRYETRHAVHRIIAFPHAWQALSSDLRRCQLNRFPCALIYCASDDDILIVAPAHLHRPPGYWRDRISEP